MRNMPDYDPDLEDIQGWLEICSELKDASQHMNDEDFDKALAAMIKYIRKPNVPPDHVRPIILYLEAIASELRMKAAFLKTFGKHEPNVAYKKQLYYSAMEALRHLVDALKFQAK